MRGMLVRVAFSPRLLVIPLLLSLSVWRGACMARPALPWTPVYNVPLAVEQPLDPLRARDRNLEMVEASPQYTVGPMPVRNFIDEFLSSGSYSSKDGQRSSHRAFRSVPVQADTPERIYEPLVCAHNILLAQQACLSSKLYLDQSIEPADEV